MKRSLRFALPKTNIFKKAQTLTAALAMLFIIFSPTLTYAQSSAQLQGDIDQLNAEISRKQSRLKSISGQADTLENKLRAIEAEISSLQAQIDRATLQIASTQRQINTAIKELEKSKRIMFENARVLYKMGSPTTIEILASSDSFSEFVNRQEYLETVKDAVNKAAQEITALRDKLQAKQKELEDYVREQRVQKQIVDNKRAEQAQLLAQTRGQESRYQTSVKELKKQRLAAEAELTAKLQSGNVGVSNGRGTAVTAGQSVSKNQLLGYVGCSGMCEGPHLHFALFQGSFKDPMPYLNDGAAWPVPGHTTIAQGYGCQSEIQYAESCGDNSWLHAGVDIAAPYGAKIVATDSGVVTDSGCWAGSGYGNIVIVTHANGSKTYYPHMGSGCN